MSEPTQEEMRIAIAEHSGWGTCPDGGRLFAKWKHYESGRLAHCDSDLLDYFTSLDACHAAECALSDEQHAKFRNELSLLLGNPNSRRMISATSEQRALAIFRALKS